MASNDISIRIVADAKDLKIGFAEAKGEIQGLRATLQQLSQSIAALTNQMRAALDQAASGMAKSAKGAEESGVQIGKALENMKSFTKGAIDGIELFGVKAVPGLGAAIATGITIVQGFYALCESMSNQLGKSWTDNDTALKHLKNTMMDALAPSLVAILDGMTVLVTRFTESYHQGGIVADVFRTISNVAAVVGAAITALAGVVDELWSVASEVLHNLAGIFGDLLGTRIVGSLESGRLGVNLFQDAFVILKDVVIVVIELIRGHIDVLVGLARNLATLLHNVFTLQWDKIQSDWQAGLRRIAIDAEATAGRIAKAMRGIGSAAVAALHGEGPPTEPKEPVRQPAQAVQKSSPKQQPPVKPTEGGGARKRGVEATPAATGTAAPTEPEADVPPRISGDFSQPVPLSRASQDAFVADVSAMYNRIGKISGTTLDDLKAKWKGVAGSVAGAWAKSLEGMIKGTQNFRGMMLNIGNAILGEAKKWITEKASAFIAKELAQTAAAITGVTTRTSAEAAGAATSTGISSTMSLQQIGHSAAVAAAGAYAAIAKIPYVGPVLAPLAAAAALAGVMALGKSIFSAEGGMGQVPYDGAMFELHKDEMVLPASLATPMRSMLIGAAANGNAPKPANDMGVTHNHYYDIKGLDGQDVHRVLMRHHASVARAAQKAFRNGYKP